MAAKKRATKKRVTKKRTVKKKTARRAPVKKRTVKKKTAPRRRNPVDTRHAVYTIADGERYYFVGYNANRGIPVFDSDMSKATLYRKPEIGLSDVRHMLEMIFDKTNRDKFEPLKTEAVKILGKTDAARKRNPAPRDKYVNQAMELFEDFRGERPEYVETVNMPIAKAGFVIGPCDGIMYTTRRDGKVEKYIHRFKKSARPLLASSHDGKQLYIVGGQYTFTERGIVDK